MVNARVVNSALTPHGHCPLFRAIEPAIIPSKRSPHDQPEKALYQDLWLPDERL
jgi:hypothetical protein